MQSKNNEDVGQNKQNYYKRIEIIICWEFMKIQQYSIGTVNKETARPYLLFSS
jgi:hypothetical protein